MVTSNTKSTQTATEKAKEAKLDDAAVKKGTKKTSADFGTAAEGAHVRELAEKDTKEEFVKKDELPTVPVTTENLPPASGTPQTEVKSVASPGTSGKVAEETKKK